MYQSPAFHGAMADSPLPATPLFSPCAEEKKGVTMTAMMSPGTPGSPPFGLRAAVAAAIATFPERRRGLKDVSNARPAKPSPKPKASPSPVRAVRALRHSGAFSPAGDSPRTRRESIDSAAEFSETGSADFSETGSATPLHTERVISLPVALTTPVASPAKRAGLTTPPPRVAPLDAPFSELGKVPELALVAPRPKKTFPFVFALVAFVALGAAVVVTAPPPAVAPVAPPAPQTYPVQRNAILRAPSAVALKAVPKATLKAVPKPVPKAVLAAPAPAKATAKKPVPAPRRKATAAAAPRRGQLARAMAPVRALVAKILAGPLPLKIAFCAAAVALAIVA